MRLFLLVLLVGCGTTTFGFSVDISYRGGLSARRNVVIGEPVVSSFWKRPRGFKPNLQSSRNGNNDDEASASSVGLLERMNRLVQTSEGNNNDANHKSFAHMSSPSSSLPNDGSVNRWGKLVDPDQELEDEIKVLAVAGAVMVALVGAIAVTNNVNIGQALADALASIQGFSLAIKDALADPQQAVQDTVATVQELGPLGPLYYVATYVTFEVLALPVIFVLTSSAGVLFGLAQGTVLALTGAAIAATISFALGRTILRGPVERWLEDLPQFRKLDRAIVSQGFQITVLERLSPFFPFALSSYVYGATAIDFSSFLLGTIVGKKCSTKDPPSTRGHTKELTFSLSRLCPRDLLVRLFRSGWQSLLGEFGRKW